MCKCNYLGNEKQHLGISWNQPPKRQTKSISPYNFAKAVRIKTEREESLAKQTKQIWGTEKESSEKKPEKWERSTISMCCENHAIIEIGSRFLVNGQNLKTPNTY